MECLLGITGKDHVVVAADMNSIESIVIMKSDEDKLHSVSSKAILAVCGNHGDTVRFSDYITNNLQLYKVKRGYELSPSAIAHFTRHCLAEALRTMTSYEVNVLMAGYDNSCPELYFIDITAAMKKMAFATHGLAGRLIASILDKNHKPGMTSVETYALLQTCIREIHKRMVLNMPNFKVKIVDQTGIRNLEPITVRTLN